MLACVLACAPPASAQITVDAYLDLASVDAVGASITGPLLDRGTHGVTRGWNGSPGGEALALGQVTRLQAVTVRGDTTYPPSHASRSIAYHHTSSFTVAELGLPSGQSALTLAGYVRLGPSDVGSASQLYDLWSIKNFPGNYCIFQLRNGGQGASGTGYYVSIETDAGGVTTHSAPVVVTPQAIYWVSLHANYVTGRCQMDVYGPATSSAVPFLASVTASQSTGSSLAIVQIGQNESGIDPGTSYFQDLVLDWSTPTTFPLGPGSIGSAQGPTAPSGLRIH
jgi:hypothetical protein